jgi:hypothetical protein
MAFFGHRRKASKDLLGLGPRIKTTILPEFRFYPFLGRWNPSRFDENVLMEEQHLT